MSLLAHSVRLGTLHSPLGDDVLTLRSLHATEQLGRLFTFAIEAASERDDLQADSLLGQAVAIETLTPAGGSRFFHGFVNQFSHAPRSGTRYYHYQFTAVPWLWFLTRQADCRIFQHQSVPDILQDVFKRRGFDTIEMNLHGHYDPWEYCVQYRETDFNFISRLMEQEGIYYYFKHTRAEHTLVLADSPDAHQPFPAYENVILRARGETHGSDDELLISWQNEHRHHTGAYVQTDYDFTRPRVDLATRNQLPGEYAHSSYEIFDYPGEYMRYEQGEEQARARMEEIRADRVIYHASGNVSGVATGHKLSVTGPAGFKDSGDYLVIGTSIQLKTGIYETGGGSAAGEDEETFQVACTLIPAASAFRSARLTPKPVIQGVQTAVVTGPAGEEIFTDKYGRIKVQFHWDREGKWDENTTCFIRVGQVWAGKRWGATFVPRIGQEVIVAFLEGDPDQPLVVGSVYNGEQMPPYLGGGLDGKHPDDKEVSGIKSCSTKGGQGYNEWRFTDTKGKEQIFLHAEKDMDVRVKNDVRTDVGGSTHLTVGFQDAQGSLYGFIKEKIFRTKLTHALKSIIEYADQFRATFVGTGGEYRERIDSDGNFAAQAKKIFSVKAGTVLIEADADSQISLQCGPSFIVLKPDGVYINGPMVYVNSGGAATDAVRLDSPPSPDEPDLADDSKSGSPSISGGQDR